MYSVYDKPTKDTYTHSGMISSAMQLTPFHHQRRHDYEEIVDDGDNNDDDDDGEGDHCQASKSLKHKNRKNNICDVLSLQNQCYGYKSFRNGVILSAATVGFMFFLLKVLDFPFFSGNDDVATVPHHHKEVIPTLLSIVDPITNEFLYALQNDLYDQLKDASFFETINDDKPKKLGKNDRTSKVAKLGASKHVSVEGVLVEYPVLNVSRTILFEGGNLELNNDVLLSWTSGIDNFGDPMVKDDDVILLHCGNQEGMMSKHATHRQRYLLEAATIAQVKATTASLPQISLHEHIGSFDFWYIPRFPMLRFEYCQFSLYGRIQTPHKKSSGRGTWLDDHESIPERFELLANSEFLNLSAGLIRPTAIHMAVTNDPNEMVINFVTGMVGTPAVQYTIASNDGIEDTLERRVVSGTSDTYTSDMLCQAPANQTEPGKFLSPGQLHTVHLHSLLPNTKYKYRVGLQTSQDISWSDEYTFITPIPAGTSEPFVYLVYGDQGCPAVGWANGKLYAAALAELELLESKESSVTNAVNNSVSPIRAIHHFGDLSYAQGAAHQWDEWFNLIQPFATKVPIMVAVGNHEYDHTSGGGGSKDPSGVLTEYGFMPDWGNFFDDSGGECGVPTSKRFTMPQGTPDHLSNSVFWYSYDFGLVHTIVLSSEHNASSGSPQHIWLENDLNTVNRSATPWVIVETHRPLYESEMSWASNNVGIAMRYEYEELLHNFQVDLVLSGHYHSYLRTCDNLYQSICYDSIGSVNVTEEGQVQRQGPTHITVGTAGAHLDMLDLYENAWTEKHIQGVYGYGRITVQNSTTLLFEFLGTGNTPDNVTVLDEVWIVRER